ncbi:MAG TPA: HD domain-containing phosphohydrolase [Dissulfurispiraceae bacterium]
MKIDLDKNLLKSIMVMGSVIEARDAYTGGHTWRVAQFARLLSEKAGLSASEIFVTSLGAFVHDIGKIGVPDAIIGKPGALNGEEFGVIKTHPNIGHDLMSVHPLAGLVLDAIAYHHERYDGKGYPYGIAGEQIPLYSRIIAVADAFDAMTSTRPYRKGMPEGQALSILEQNSGTQFDEKLVSAFLSLSQAGHFSHIIGHSDHGRRLVECPFCGPVIAVSKNTKNGDTINCKVCKGIFQLHIQGDTFEAEFKNEKVFNIKPEAEMEQIEEFIREFPAK